jgi:4-hydroxy-2-oxoheptanedioate aldolase
MELMPNTFKEALKASRPQIGLWVGLASAYAAELLATTGFDWLLLDGEHAPNDPRSVLPQLQAIAPYPCHAVVRPVHADTALIKQYLDIGAQTLLLQMIDTPAQATAAVAATWYPPRGVRGVGSALARASRWNAIPDYLHRASESLCVLVQADSQQALPPSSNPARRLASSPRISSLHRTTWRWAPASWPSGSTRLCWRDRPGLARLFKRDGRTAEARAITGY